MFLLFANTSDSRCGTDTASAVYAMHGGVCPSVRLSVCPSSVIFRCFVEMNEATIMRFSPSDSKIILVSEEVQIVWKFAADHPIARELK